MRYNFYGTWYMALKDVLLGTAGPQCCKGSMPVLVRQDQEGAVQKCAAWKAAGSTPVSSMSLQSPMAQRPHTDHTGPGQT